METNKINKMLIAVIQGDDYESVVSDLTHNGFYVTQLNSVGGFLKRRSMTIMVGLAEERLEEALTILKKRAGQRTETVYHNQMLPGSSIESTPAVPLSVPTGGVAVFVLDMERMERF